MKKEIIHFSNTVFFEIEQLSTYIETLGKEFFENHNVEINHDEFRTLNVILCNPDICQRDLARLILRDRTRTGRLLDSLESKNLIIRFNDTKNNRLVRKMNLTKKGEDLYFEQYNILSKVMENLLVKFTPAQMEELRGSLKLLTKAISEVVEIKV